MGKKNLTKSQIEHIAELAELEISGEAEKFSELLSDTLDYIDVFGELDTSSVKPTFQVTGLKNIFQENNMQKATLNKNEALSNAPETSGDLFVTDAVFDR